MNKNGYISVESYVPEISFFEEKDGAGCRACFEDCAVIDTNQNNAVVAFRGLNLPNGGDYFQFLGLGERESTRIKSALSRASRVVIPCKIGILLVFGELLGATGLLVTLLLPPTKKFSDVPSLYGSVCRSFEALGRRDFVLLGELTEKSPRIEDRDTAHRLCELLYYPDSILSQKPLRDGIWTLSLRIANFAGCKLEKVGLPVRDVDCPPMEISRLVAFLLCAFLTLRQQSGTVSAEGEEAPFKNAALCYRVTLQAGKKAGSISTRSTEHNAETKNNASLEKRFPFLSCPCFRSFALKTEDGEITLEATLKSTAPHAVFATGGGAYVHLHVSLSARSVG